MKVKKGDPKPRERENAKYKPTGDGFLSGWCNLDAAEWSHERCRGEYSEARCVCSCHAS